MKAHSIILITLQLICQIFGETIQRGNIENVKPVTSEVNNLDLFSSTYQLQKLLQKEVQIVQELEKYLAILQKEIETVQNRYDSSTAEAFRVVQKSGEMVVRTLDPRQFIRLASETVPKINIDSNVSKYKIAF